MIIGRTLPVLLTCCLLAVPWLAECADRKQAKSHETIYYDRSGKPVRAGELYDSVAEPTGGLDAFRRNIYYPPWERSLRLGGDVQVFVSLDATGKVLESRVLASTRRNFDRVVLSAVRGTKWRPAMKNGSAVPSSFSFWIRFVPWPKGS